MRRERSRARESTAMASGPHGPRGRGGAVCMRWEEGPGAPRGEEGVGSDMPEELDAC